MLFPAYYSGNNASDHHLIFPFFHHHIPSQDDIHRLTDDSRIQFQFFCSNPVVFQQLALLIQDQHALVYHTHHGMQHPACRKVLLQIGTFLDLSCHQHAHLFQKKHRFLQMLRHKLFPVFFVAGHSDGSFDPVIHNNRCRHFKKRITGIYFLTAHAVRILSRIINKHFLSCLKCIPVSMAISHIGLIHTAGKMPGCRHPHMCRINDLHIYLQHGCQCIGNLDRHILYLI